MKQWLEKNCEIFSYIAGEDVTYKDVVITHAGILVIILACGLAEWINSL